MLDLVSSFRQYTSESGTAIFGDDEIQNIFDNNKYSIVKQPLSYASYLLSGTTQYINASIPQQFLEGTASGTALVRMFNAQGTVFTGYQSNFTQGEFTFTANTLGTAYYYTGYNYNFYKAVSDGWFRKAGFYAGNFDFKIEGREYKKSSVFKQCMEMKDYYAGLANPNFGIIDRGDYYGGFDNSQRFDLHANDRIRSAWEYSG